MNPQTVFCPNLSCPARGQQNKGNIGVHSEVEHRYICHECGDTFSATKGTLFYRLRTDAVTVMIVITLMAYGCPVPAIVKAYEECGEPIVFQGAVNGKGVTEQSCIRCGELNEVDFREHGVTQPAGDRIIGKRIQSE